jgi:hypothetical protein
MDTFEALRHFVRLGDCNVFSKFLRVLCEERVLGQSLTYCILLQLEDALKDIGAEACLIRDVVSEIKVMEDIDAIDSRRRVYFAQHLCAKMPKPLTKLIIAYVAPPAPTRSKPTRFTYTERYKDECGRVWVWAPYTFEAWWEDSLEVSE